MLMPRGAGGRPGQHHGAWIWGCLPVEHPVSVLPVNGAVDDQQDR